MKAGTNFLFGLFALAGSAGALSCRYIKPEFDSRPVLGANLRFNVKASSVWMWRVVRDNGANCTLRDFPYPKSLSRELSAQTRKTWARQNKREFFMPAFQPEAESTTRVSKASNSPRFPLRQNSLFSPKPAPDTVTLPNLTWEMPPALANSSVRLGAHRCTNAVAGRGSAVLVSPQLLLTAAHVVADDTGALCDAYRAVPGGRAYTENEPSPNGVYITRNIKLSGRGGWIKGNTPAVAESGGQMDKSIRHDWAILSLKATVPNVSAWPLLRFKTMHTAASNCASSIKLAPSRSNQVIKIGYPLQSAFGEYRQGKPTTNIGFTSCDDRLFQVAPFALFSNVGDSGAGILAFPKDANSAFELRSLVSASEWRHNAQIVTLGPIFDLIDYQRILNFIQKQK
jgi:hypothetical protein